MKKQKKHAIRSIICLIFSCCLSSALSAQTAAVKPRQKPTTSVAMPVVEHKAAKTGPDTVTLEADRVEGIYKQEMEAIGDAKLCHAGMTLTADRMKYFPQTKDAEVTGNIRLDRKNDFIQGDYLKLNLDTQVGFLTEPRYTMKEGDGRGTGEQLFFEGKNQYRLKKGEYTTCPVDDEDWYIRASDLKIDSEKEVGEARNVSVVFKGVPILYTPWLDFSYTGQRKSGFLAPVVGHTKRSGADLAIPFYINIAPNMDATIAPRVMSQRGFMLSNEARYIGHGVHGRVQADVLPDDFDTHKTRYGVSFQHAQYLGHGWRGQLDYNRVSDNRFLRDLSNNLSQTSRTNLLQQAGLFYHGDLGLDGTISFSAIAQRFQTLQDPFLPQDSNLLIISPYKRLPQLTMNAIKRNVAGMDFGLNATWTNFAHSSADRAEGKRLTLYPTVSVPFRNSYGFITPKFGLHYTQYALSENVGTVGSNTDRTIPIVSLDSGVIFDRNVTIGGNHYIQTLEPRAFYVYAPFKDQSFLPNFDSAESDFSFAQMLTENRFSGHDRINDANQITLALTSRLLEPSTGIERLRAAVGQQFRFSDRKVILDSSQITSRRADFIAAVAGRITREISTDVNIQLDQQSLRTEKIRAGISYQPELGKVINLGYRYTRDVRESIDIPDNQLNTAIKQVDTSIQWPFFSNWHTVARVNYSLRDDRLLAGLAGFEYISCCYKFRVVVQKLTTATSRTTTAVFVQLELNGLMNIGSNPLRVLQQSIPGYSSIY
ncbi:LPS-assembly protein LptD [Nitrosomonas sp.]|uniref:LPS-assembly protein LptD n=2 Tax=Nitrosomonas sp. TaxID=42353 RepID=UPI0028431220|nr:LPS-assembly protein LptD [Nitrosomonas sp.]MDR4514742.1 LPS-assembly protein LptD [Nitrosomonas sp.]